MGEPDEKQVEGSRDLPKQRRQQQNSSSSLEECGFVTHLMLVVMGILYVSCVPMPRQQEGDELPVRDSFPNFLGANALRSLSPPDSICRSIDRWSIILPAILTILFWTAPVIYFLVNYKHALTMPSTSPIIVSVGNGLSSATESPKGKDTATSSVLQKSTEPMGSTSSPSSYQVPEIRSVDVGIINDLFYQTMSEKQQEQLSARK
mmetsp:Transcript_27036/g.56622  ORF Transcript_27036/g.56622 Transcript_27036/m.56622 type:complete len:205 (-) Transcript_27036:1346-1960(-)